MKKKVLFLMCLLLVAGATQAALIQHLDATRADSVILGTEVLDPTDPNIVVGYAVSTWKDLSGNGNDAVSKDGIVTYPSFSMAAGGFDAGLDMGIGKNTLTLFDADGAKALLNSNPPVDPNDGIGSWSFLIAIKFADFTGNQQYQMAAGGTTLGNLGVHTENSGNHRIRLNQNISDAGGSANNAKPGDTVVVAATFDASNPSSNNFKYYTNNIGLTQGRPLGNYGNSNLLLGAQTNLSNEFSGMVGEVLWYNDALSDDAFEYQRDRLQRKWQESRAVEPLDGGEAISGDIELKWNNLLPYTQGDDVYVDVYFGTDPNRLTMTPVVTDGLNTTAVTIANGVAGNTYYWAVDTSFGYAAGDDDPNLLRGPFFSFTPVADPAPAAIDAGLNYMSWPGEGVPINAIVTDEGASAVTVTFTASDPNMVFDPNPVVIAGGGGTASTTATIDHAAGVVTVTATAEDAANLEITVTDTMTIQVYGDACQAARIGKGLASNYPADLVLGATSACKIDLEDFAALAAQWLVDYSATEAFLAP